MEKQALPHEMRVNLIYLFDSKTWFRAAAVSSARARQVRISSPHPEHWSGRQQLERTSPLLVPPSVW